MAVVAGVVVAAVVMLRRSAANRSSMALGRALLALLLGIVGSTPIIPALSAWRTTSLTRWRAIGFDAAATASLMVIFGAAILQMAARTYNPFIYFRF